MRHPRVRQVMAWSARDWRGPRYLAWGATVLALTSLVTICYYANTAHPGMDPDTTAYLRRVAAIFDTHQFVDPARLPGYPTFIALLFLATGRGNLDAVSVAQGILYVLATLELYAALCLALRRAWVAALIVAPIALNTHLLSYVRPLLSEGLTLFLLATLALALVVALRWPRPPALWGVTVALAALFMTRPEWIYLPIPLFACLLVLAWRRGLLRRLLPTAILALAALYGTLGGYVILNHARNDCACVTYIPNVNLLGKVMQYRMVRDAPPQYATMTQLVLEYVERGDADPWSVLREDYPPLIRDHFALAGDYSAAIIRAHPVEFLAKSGPVAIEALTTVNPFLPIDPHGPFAAPLLAINTAVAAIMRYTLPFFSLLGACWLLWMLRLWWRRKPSVLTDAMGLFALIGGYGLALTIFGGYIYYARLRAPYTPLLLIVVWGSAVLAALWLGGRTLAWWRGRRGIMYEVIRILD
jgi:hypothetical protein